MTRKTNAQLAKENEKLQVQLQEIQEQLALRDLEKLRDDAIKAPSSPAKPTSPDDGYYEGNIAKWITQIRLPSAWSIMPWAIAIIALVIWYRGQTTTPPGPDPGPEPTPDVLSIEQATAQTIPAMRKAFAETFEEAAKLVESKRIVNDERLDEFVNAAIVNARQKANKPFDISFNMSLPRNDDGTFAGRESEAAKFLRQISRSW